MGKDHIPAGARPFGKSFSLAGLDPEAPPDVKPDAGKRGSESTFVHFRQLFRRGWHEQKSIDTTGKHEHSAPIRPQVGTEAAFPLSPLFIRQYGDRR